MEPGKIYHRPDGKKECKDCRQAAYKRYKATNADRIRSRNLTYRQNNPSQIKQSRKGWEDRNPDKVRLHKRRDHLKRTYGLSLEDYETLEANQRGLCAICKKDCGLVVDHDHTTGEVRGLLCNDCNQGIGRLGDDPDVVAAALEYLLQKKSDHRSTAVGGE